jgi:hypothetical protein
VAFVPLGFAVRLVFGSDPAAVVTFRRGIGGTGKHPPPREKWLQLLDSNQRPGG